MDTDVCHAVHISMAKQSKAKLFQMIELDPKFVIDYLGLLVFEGDDFYWLNFRGFSAMDRVFSLSTTQC